MVNVNLFALMALPFISGELCQIPNEMLMDSDTGLYRCCKPIVCLPGFEAVMCKEGDPKSSDCERCPHDRFRSSKSVLGQHDRCNLKTRCEEPHMKIARLGNETHDNVCGCDEGYRLSPTYPLNCLRRISPPTERSNSVEVTSTQPSEPPTTACTERHGKDLPETYPHAMVFGLGAVIIALILTVGIILLVWRLRRQPPAEDNGGSVDQHAHIPLIQSSLTDHRTLMKLIGDFEFHRKAFQKIIYSVVSENISSRNDLDKFTRILYRNTNVKESIRNNIIGNAQDMDTENLCHALLTRWRESMGHQARVEHVLLALEEASLQGIIDTVCCDISADQDLKLYLHSAQSSLFSQRDSGLHSSVELEEVVAPPAQETIIPDNCLASVDGSSYKPPSKRGN